MLISRSRSRFWTIVSSRDPVYVAMCVIRASIFTRSLDFSTRSNLILVSFFSPVLEFLKVSGLDLQ